jgi:antitoxin (DNA-binding transcriptional repressor) of toxin-antitoxin stability system
MKTVSIHDAKTNLSKYIAAAKKGEKIYIGGFGRAEVVLVKLSQKEGTASKHRSFAAAKGKVIATSDAFSEPTDQTIAALMLGE